MFVYLSKLLPLFVYPLGLTCIGLGLTLYWLWKYPRRAAIAASLALGCLVLASNSWVSLQLIQSLEWRHLPPPELPQAEAIVVLGGSLRPVSYPQPGVHVSEAGDRVIHAARLFKAGKAPLIVLSGGRIDWKGGGSPESADMATLLMELGVPRQALLEDPTSLNTYQNAVNVKTILRNYDVNRILLVTSAMHMPRSLAIFKKQGIEAIAAPTDFLVTEQVLQERTDSLQSAILNILPTADNLYYTSRAIKEYIGFVIYRLRGWL